MALADRRYVPDVLTTSLCHTLEDSLRKLDFQVPLVSKRILPSFTIVSAESTGGSLSDLRNRALKGESLRCVYTVQPQYTVYELYIVVNFVSARLFCNFS